MFQLIRREERTLQFVSDDELDKAILDEEKNDSDPSRQKFIGCDIAQEVIDRMCRTIQFASVYLKEKDTVRKKGTLRICIVHAVHKETSKLTHQLVGGFEYSINLPFDRQKGIKNPIFSPGGSEYLMKEWLKKPSLWSPSVVMIAESALDMKMAKSNQHAEGIVKYEKHNVDIDQHIHEPATYMHYCWDDLCNSGKVFRKEVGQSDSIMTRKKRECRYFSGRQMERHRRG